ncbi:uncharacterized protein LOC130511293 [Raphanus sativus]|uniref:Uncharacterized protein LOC130511293 n=1 Tax=Raphanus sativus TaxID=3726 RepID=A0A9W3DJX7_RAPSA|nr:uncharacterized protein LOC130511293 [Raphanus sativus]
MDSDFLIDIIGQAIDVSELQTLNCGEKERKKIDFNLRDINDQRIACCLWGKFAEVMDSHREEAQFGVVVCLLRFAKLGSFRGKIQVSNAFDSSQLIFDPNIKEVEGLKEMFKLHLKVKDDTAETKLILLDWIATPLLGVKAEKFLDGSLEELEDPEMLPPCIIDVVGKTFKFGVDVVKDNINYNALMVDSQSDAITETGASTHSVSERPLLTYSDESSGLVKTPSKRSQ